MNILCLLVVVYSWVVVIRVITSWFPISPNGKLAAPIGFLYTITDPLLLRLRRLLPPVRFGYVGLDLSPLVALFALFIIQGLICR